MSEETTVAIEVTKDFKFAHRGCEIIEYKAGAQVDVSPRCAEVALGEKWAKPASKTKKAAPENKDAGASPENKAAE